MNKNRRRSRIISALLLTLFVGYVANTTLFVHSHIIDGRLITHSHPYRGTADNPGHGHSQAQSQTIAQLSQLLATAAPTAVTTCSIAGKRIRRNLGLPSLRNNSLSLPYGLRAPPRA